MNMGIEKWKRYLYPFGDITAEKKDPAADQEAQYRTLGQEPSRNKSMAIQRSHNYSMQ